MFSDKVLSLFALPFKIRLNPFNLNVLKNGGQFIGEKTKAN